LGELVPALGIASGVGSRGRQWQLQRRVEVAWLGCKFGKFAIINGI